MSFLGRREDKPPNAGGIAGMMPPLPRLDEALAPGGGTSFEGLALQLLAAAAGGLLVYAEYGLLAETVRRVFGEKALRAGFQARFHGALLHSSGKPRELAFALVQQAEA